MPNNILIINNMIKWVFKLIKLCKKSSKVMIQLLSKTLLMMLMGKILTQNLNLLIKN